VFNSLHRPDRRGLRLRAGAVVLALGAARDVPPEDAPEREGVARGAADRPAGARVCERVGAGRAEGWIARLRLGEAVLARDGLVVRDRAPGVDRVTCARSLAGAEPRIASVRDRAVGRGASVEGAGAREVEAPTRRTASVGRTRVARWAVTLELCTGVCDRLARVLFVGVGLAELPRAVLTRALRDLVGAATRVVRL
jgi:hypothetical protein